GADTLANFIPIQRLLGFLAQQLQQVRSIAVGNSGKLNGLNDSSFIGRDRGRGNGSRLALGLGYGGGQFRWPRSARCRPAGKVRGKQYDDRGQKWRVPSQQEVSLGPGSTGFDGRRAGTCCTEGSNSSPTADLLPLGRFSTAP